MRGGQTMTRQDIAEELSLSMPTVLQHVTQLIEAGILEEWGTAQSNGGRKAKTLRLRPETSYVLGINIGIRLIEFVTTDLLGNLLQSSSISLPFRDEPDWYTQFQCALLDFFEQYRVDSSQILGAGISFPVLLTARGIRSSALIFSEWSTWGWNAFKRPSPVPPFFIMTPTAPALPNEARAGTAMSTSPSTSP